MSTKVGLSISIDSNNKIFKQWKLLYKSYTTNKTKQYKEYLHLGINFPTLQDAE